MPATARVPPHCRARMDQMAISDLWQVLHDTVPYSSFLRPTLDLRDLRVPALPKRYLTCPAVWRARVTPTAFLFAKCRSDSWSRRLVGVIKSNIRVAELQPRNSMFLMLRCTVMGRDDRSHWSCEIFDSTRSEITTARTLLTVKSDHCRENITLWLSAEVEFPLVTAIVMLPKLEIATNALFCG